MKVTTEKAVATVRRCVDDWPELPVNQPAVPVLDQIRHRKVYGPPLTADPIRKGGAEPKAIVAETREFVIYRVWSSTGKDLGESCLPKAEFEEQFERRTR